MPLRYWENYSRKGSFYYFYDFQNSLYFPRTDIRSLKRKWVGIGDGWAPRASVVDTRVISHVYSSNESRREQRFRNRGLFSRMTSFPGMQGWPHTTVTGRLFYRLQCFCFQPFSFQSFVSFFVCLSAIIIRWKQFVPFSPVVLAVH